MSGDERGGRPLNRPRSVNRSVSPSIKRKISTSSSQSSSGISDGAEHFVVDDLDPNSKKRRLGGGRAERRREERQAENAARKQKLKADEDEAAFLIGTKQTLIQYWLKCCNDPNRQTLLRNAISTQFLDSKYIQPLAKLFLEDANATHPAFVEIISLLAVMRGEERPTWAVPISFDLSGVWNQPSIASPGIRDPPIGGTTLDSDLASSSNGALTSSLAHGDVKSANVVIPRVTTTTTEFPTLRSSVNPPIAGNVVQSPLFSTSGTSPLFDLAVNSPFMDIGSSSSLPLSPQMHGDDNNA